MSRKWKARRPLRGRGSALGNDLGGARSERPQVTATPDFPQSARYRDKHGHLLSAAVMTNWSPQMLKVMGVRRIDAGEGGDQ
jgi:hypothetical protein